MKKIFMMLIVLLLTVSVSATDFVLTVNVSQNEETMDNIGVETQADRRWSGFELQSRTPSEIEGIQLAVSAGINRINPYDTIIDDIPVGVSALYDIEINETSKADIEIGIKYHFLNFDSPDFNVNIQDPLTYSIGINYEKDISEQIAFIVGSGYQWNLERDNVKVNGWQTNMNNSLEGMYLKAGIVLRIN